MILYGLYVTDKVSIGTDKRTSVKTYQLRADITLHDTKNFHEVILFRTLMI